MEQVEQIFIHDTASVDPRSEIGSGSKIWMNVQVRENAKIGSQCVISKDVYIDESVSIGNRCKIQNSVSVYKGVEIDDDVFVGPNACFTNDLIPRAFNQDWKISKTFVGKGASIGANATIICGVTIGSYSMIGAGAVVTKDVPKYSLVIGNPAKVVGMVDKNGNRKSK
jgi:UDP-2-acetamido-3-amino-2,3-dideoxy-glucuronate N-acetyltransferase